MGSPIAAGVAEGSRSSDPSGTASRSRSGGLSVSRPAQMVIALTVVGALMRFLTLDVQSLNVDEADTVLLLHRSFSGMLSHLSHTESSPPLYYILTWGWGQVFGLGTVGLRSFSALVGTATIPVMYLAGRQTSVRAGLWAAALTTVSSSMYFYAQETRCYPLLILFVAAAYIMFRRALAQPDGARLWQWAGMSALALVTHYFAAFIILPEAIILARRIDLRRVALPACAIGAVGLALVPLAVAERADGKTNWIEELSLSGRIAESVKVMTVAKYTYEVLPVVALFLLLGAASVWLLARRGTAPERSAGIDAVIIAAVALAIPLALSVSHVIDVFDGTNMVAVSVPLILLISYGVGAEGAGRAGAAIGVALCAIGAAMILTTNLMPVYQRDDWRGVADSLGRSSGRAIVIVSRNVDALQVYLGDLSTDYRPSVTAREVDFAALRKRRTVGGPLAAQVPTGALPGYRLAGVTRTDTYAISRYVATGPGTVTVAELRRLKEEPSAEVLLQG